MGGDSHVTNHVICLLIILFFLILINIFEMMYLLWCSAYVWIFLVCTLVSYFRIFVDYCFHRCVSRLCHSQCHSHLVFQKVGPTSSSYFLK